MTRGSRRRIDRSGVVEEAARIMCEEGITDFRLAKRKATERLGLDARSAMPDNAAIKDAIIDYQRLYGGDAYLQRLRSMREIAIRVMEIIVDFEPRLVGGAINGAISAAHKVQIHAFADKAELLDLHLQQRSLNFQPGERDFRYPGGSVEEVPMVTLKVASIGVDIAIFCEDDRRRPPLSPSDGLPYQRLGLDAVRALIAADAPRQGSSGILE